MRRAANLVIPGRDLRSWGTNFDPERQETRREDKDVFIGGWDGGHFGIGALR